MSNSYKLFYILVTPETAVNNKLLCAEFTIFQIVFIFVATVKNYSTVIYLSHKIDLMHLHDDPPKNIWSINITKNLEKNCDFK